ncbi:MAG: zinc-binding dehydrogenase [Candidatus Binatia bacterium]
MKAVRIHHHGGVEQLRFEETADPQLQSSDDVIVHLKAAALHHTDRQIRQGSGASQSCLSRIPGSDGAGVVAAVGSAVSDFKAGDAVCLYPQSGCGACRACRSERQSLCEQPHRLGATVDGTYAEYVRLGAQNCFALPAGFSYEEGAAIAVDFVSAWRMLITNAELKPGELVLIRGVGDGAATAALQLALRLGAHAIVTADSAAKIAKAKALGAAHGIDEQSQDFPLEVRRLTAKRGVDVVVDCIGGENWPKSFAALARGGRLVTCGARAGAQPATDLRRIFWHHLKVFGSSCGSRDELRQVLNGLDSSGTKPIIDTVFPLAQAAMAQRRLAAGRHFGKIILDIDGKG